MSGADEPRAFTGAGWRSPGDGPRWLYAAPGRLRAPWRLVVFGMALLVLHPILESALTPTLGALGDWAGVRLEAYPWVMLASVWAAVVLALRVVDDRPWGAVGVAGDAWRPQTLATGAVLGTVALTLTMGLLLLTGGMQLERVSERLLDGAASGDRWGETAARLALLLAPAALWEELLFRGYLWEVANAAAGARVALPATAVAFGTVHLMNPNVTVLSAVNVVLAGVALGMLRQRTGSVAGAWMAHWAWNWLMAAVWHVPVSGIPFTTPDYRAVATGSVWWTGGAWGPEGGIAATVVLSGAVWWGASRASAADS